MKQSRAHDVRVFINGSFDLGHKRLRQTLSKQSPHDLPVIFKRGTTFDDTLGGFDKRSERKKPADASLQVNT